MSNQHKRLLDFAEYRLDCEQGVLYRQDTVVSLTPKAIQTLIFLAERSGEVVTKDELMQAIWPDTFVEEGNLTFNIHLIRKALNAREEQPFIETLSKRGYRFVAEVRVAPEETAPASTPRPAPLRLRWMWASAFLVVAAVAAVILTGLLDRFAPILIISDPGPLPALVQLTIHNGSNSQPDVSPDGRRVVFVSNRDGGRGQIYVMDSGGWNPRNLTRDKNIHDDSPAWSPDGRKIAFQSNRRGTTEIFTMDADGGNPTPITPGSRAAWSPDGSMLAYVRSIDGHNEIFVIRSDAPATNAQPRQLTFDHHFCADPTWSPDGSRIAFTAKGENHLEVHAVRADGSDRVVLPASRGDDRLPVWSRDGRIAFNSNRDGQEALYLMESDGALQHKISGSDFASDAYDAEAAWWPDGRSLIFESDRSGTAEIYRMRLPDTPDGAIRLTGGTPSNQHPAWSPDGRWIAFESTRDGKPNIFLMDSDGGAVKNLTRSTAGNYEPAWSWDGTRLAFSSDRGGKRAIYTMNADGADTKKVSEGDDDRNPAWSPDGRICFDRAGEIWIVGKGPSRHAASGTQCSWSADGRAIVLARNAPNAIEIFTMNPQGGEAVALTNNGHGNGAPEYSRNGARIAFNSNSDGYGFGIFVLQPGRKPVRITARGQFDNQPSWSPDGRWIVFARDRDHTWDLYKIAVPPSGDASDSAAR